jgi:hypothetical protein
MIFKNRTIHQAIRGYTRRRWRERTRQIGSGRMDFRAVGGRRFVIRRM